MQHPVVIDKVRISSLCLMLPVPAYCLFMAAAWTPTFHQVLGERVVGHVVSHMTGPLRG